MNSYEYAAATIEGSTVTGRAWADNEVELDRDLEQKGLTLTTARVVAGERSRKRLRIPREDLISLTTQLATVSSAGVRIVEGLSGIGRRLANESSRNLVAEMVEQLKAGESLSAAMDRHPGSFPDVYRASVRAGEASGSLDRVLARMARYLEWVRGMRGTTIQALIYPAILFFALFGLVLVLLYYVLPQIIGLFPGGRDDLPAETRLVLAASDFLTGNWVVLLVLSVAAVVALAHALRQPAARVVFDGLLLKLPKMGRVLQQIATSKFASTAAILQQAGCDVFSVLNIAAATCGNAAMAAAYSRTSEGVRRGLTITEGLEREPLVDPLLIQMVSVGEKSGQLEGSLGRLVEYYDEEIPRTVKRFLSLLEPAMLLTAGMVVAFILFAAIMPIFTLYETLG